ncbi:MAG: response regulator transcription factor [Chitinophagaceae bacterium]
MRSFGPGMMKILLIEDEASVVSLVKRGLTENGMDVSVAMDGATGLQMAGEQSYDVLLLDIMLPDTNGIQVCKTLRQGGMETPILMLTALGSTENIVTGLNSGADDYLVKPFKLTELVARIQALGRRNNRGTVVKQDLQVLRIADLELNLATRQASRNNTVINLTSTEYRLLEFFMKNANRVLSRMEILENVWEIDFNLGTNVVDVYVNYLRRKIDKDFDPRLIHTMIGMGYIMKEQPI